MIHVKYKIWFSLKVEVEDFSGDVLALCSLVPTSECLRLINNSRIAVKTQPNRITHLIEVFPDGPQEDVPLYPPPSVSGFRYQLVSNGQLFYQQTNIETLDPVNYTIFLSNNANNKSGSNLFTHKTGNTAGSNDRIFKAMFPDVQKDTLAVADVYQHNLVSADYRLQDADGKCLEPEFIIRFAKHS